MIPLALCMFQSEGYHTYYIYIITNKTKTVLYTGVTNHLKARLFEHQESINPGFTSKYNVKYCIIKSLLGFMKPLPEKKKLKDGEEKRKLN
jgi:putative endonuclease